MALAIGTLRCKHCPTLDALGTRVSALHRLTTPLQQVQQAAEARVDQFLRSKGFGQRGSWSAVVDQVRLLPEAVRMHRRGQQLAVEAARVGASGGLAEAPQIPGFRWWTRHRALDGTVMLSERRGNMVLASEQSLAPGAGGHRLPERRVLEPELRLAFVADSGTGDDRQQLVGDMIRRAHADYGFHGLFHGGDVVYPHGIASKDDPRIDQMIRDPYPDDLEFFLALGNHEYADGDGVGDVDAFRQHAAEPGAAFVHPGRYFSVPYRVGTGRHEHTVEVFVIDTSTFVTEPEQVAWFKKALADSSAERKLVVGHHPPETIGHHGPFAPYRDLIMPMLEGVVDSYAAGHEHDQQVIRTKEGVLMIVNGAGGREARPLGKVELAAYASNALGYTEYRIGPDGIRVDMMNAETNERAYQEHIAPHGRTGASAA